MFELGSPSLPVFSSYTLAPPHPTHTQSLDPPPTQLCPAVLVFPYIFLGPTSLQHCLRVILLPHTAIMILLSSTVPVSPFSFTLSRGPYSFPTVSVCPASSLFLGVLLLLSPIPHNVSWFASSPHPILVLLFSTTCRSRPLTFPTLPFKCPPLLLYRP